jgi:hypothetical protein
VGAARVAALFDAPVVQVSSLHLTRSGCSQDGCTT